MVNFKYNYSKLVNSSAFINKANFFRLHRKLVDIGFADKTRVQFPETNFIYVHEEYNLVIKVSMPRYYKDMECVLITKNYTVKFFVNCRRKESLFVFLDYIYKTHWWN